MKQEMQYIYQVYQSGSFSKAAQALYLTQPALSIAIQKVEAEIGMPLFIRDKKPLELTDAGKVYIEKVKEILHLEAELSKELSDLSSLNIGNLVLGGTHYLNSYPLASAFLTRSIIEQSIKYYSHQHYIQGQGKLIWANIEKLSKLSQIIDNYKKNLANYITDTTIRDYFTALFDNYNDTVNPLNWVVHRPSEFQLDASTLIELPRKGLLAVINYFLTF